ncbi:Oidioi.mRNA.OKI2018_I69.chr2.g4777.t1.cds [Oikopleura dioica]|uniref:Oidioi.mRNA.OKI2018_I69.chr2.g4777.t1.cds n=1 Tax=Oikopleura dioica TaxID=34765 RepID=A0ABN7SYT0_OIKDI|nr:Oidioi.mRNA.OKI2018_I69.chr2.g4777.t1.cds [Oikopleura dioica]
MGNCFSGCGKAWNHDQKIIKSTRSWISEDEAEEEEERLRTEELEKIPTVPEESPDLDINSTTSSFHSQSKCETMYEQDQMRIRKMSTISVNRLGDNINQINRKKSNQSMRSRKSLNSIGKSTKRESKITIDAVFSEIISCRNEDEKERMETSMRIARNSFNKWRTKARNPSTITETTETEINA